ncbi:hypothetical protein L596_022832 [Steinernema carpocapsae]|nr:hypothetical protein L596_022832 [Steinernema carpocapsae]
MRTLISVIVLISLATSAYGYISHVTVTGQVSCGNSGVFAWIELCEHDLFDPDDVLNRTLTSLSGKFRVYGEENEFMAISPYLRINHDCAIPAKGHQCYHVTIFDIPRHKVGGAYEMGLIDLKNPKMGSSDEIVCKHSPLKDGFDGFLVG